MFPAGRYFRLRYRGASAKASHGVYAAFNTAEPGILDGEATSLIITNCCAQNNVRLSAIHVDGIDIAFATEKVTLAPGESVEIPFTGEIPEVSKKVFSVTVYYTMDTITPIGYRTQNFTVMNGDAVENQGGTKEFR